MRWRHFPVLFGLSILAVSSVFAGDTAARSDIFAREHEYDDFRIVLDYDAPEPDHTAARAFQKYWQESTGQLIPLLAAREPGKINVFIGAYTSPRLDETEFTPEEVDGVIIQTVIKRERPRIWRLNSNDKRRLPIELRDLHIGGGPPRGTLFAVYEFFERYMGVRFLTPDDTHVPRPPEFLPEIDLRYVPPFVRRDVSFHSIVENPEFAAAMRLNGPWAGLPPEMGGHIRQLFGRDRFAHTYHEYVPPWRYFDEHPEYFALVNGQRDPEGQLCLTNSDLPEIVADAILQRAMEQNMPHGIADLSQMDFAPWCECPKCATIIAEEGGPSGLNIRFVNDVAERVEARSPGVLLQTLAYQATRKPPRHARPRDNVVVGVCALEVDNARPVFDKNSTRNADFLKDLQRWREIARYVFVWDYTQNWYAHQGPHPIYPTIQPNAAHYADMGINSIFHQAVPVSPHSDFEHLKAYILSRTLWNPSLDGRALYDEFLRLYYREAAPYIRAYHALLAEQVARTGTELTMANTMTWMDAPTVERAQAIFADAFAHVSNEETRERLQYAYVPVQYAALVAPADVRYAGDALVLKRPHSQTFDEYWAMLQEYGVTHLNDYAIDVFRERLRGETPPRFRELSLARLENDHWELWFLPEEGGALVRLHNRNFGRDMLPPYFELRDPSTRALEWRERNGRLWPVGSSQGTVTHSDNASDFNLLLEDGIRLTRTIALSEERVVIRWTVTNEAGENHTPNLTVRPKISSDDATIWVERGGDWDQWRSIDDDGATEETFAAALRFGKADETFLVRYEGDVGGSVLSWDKEAQQAVLGARFIDTPIAPGESRTITAEFRLTDTHPRRL